MKYDITKPSAPKMPTPRKRDRMYPNPPLKGHKTPSAPLLPAPFTLPSAHKHAPEFQYPDLTWKETCSQMANLVAESGGNKGHFSLLVEAICRDFRHHDEEELKKLVEWQRQIKPPLLQRPLRPLPPTPPSTTINHEP